MNTLSIDSLKIILFEFSDGLDLVKFRRVNRIWKALIENELNKPIIPSFEECIIKSDYYYFGKYYLKYVINDKQKQLIFLTKNKIFKKYYKIVRCNANKNNLLAEYSGKGDIDTVSYLLEIGSNVNASNDCALRWSCKNGHIDIVKLLLENGANPDSLNGEALTKSVINNDIEIVELLLKYGTFTPFVFDKTIEYAIGHRRQIILKLLLGKKSYDVKEAVRRAISNHRIDIMEDILKANPDNKISDEDILIMASRYGCIKLVESLIKKGANIHAEEDSALIESAQFGEVDTVKLLLKNGANIHAKGDKALRISAMFSKDDVVKLLLENGADIHARNDYLFEHGIKNFHPNVIKLLKKWSDSATCH
jgi:ankyrin repeat protein